MAIVEMRTYRLKPGSIPEAVKRFGEAVEGSGRSKISPLGAFFHTEVGPLNRIIHCWPYASLDERDKKRARGVEAAGLAAEDPANSSRRWSRRSSTWRRSRRRWAIAVSAISTRSAPTRCCRARCRP